MYRILILDDDAKIRSIYRAVLEMEGFSVMEAAEWPECLTYLLQYKYFDLVLLDINMPGVDGSVVYDILRLYDPKIRVIMSSVYSLDEQKRLVLKADDYFDKSMGTDLLVRKVKDVMSRHAYAEQEEGL